MVRKLFAVGLFTLACSVSLYADAAEEAPAPRPVEDKKPGEGKFGGKLGGKFGEKFGKFGGKIDPAKLKDLKDKLGKVDPEKLKELKGKFGDLKGKIDPEKLKELKGKFKKGGEE